MLKILKICVNIAFVGAIITYPFMLFFDFTHIVAFLMFLCALSALKYTLNRDNLALISAIFLGILIVVRFTFSGVWIVGFFYPTIINLVFLAFFALSLKGEAIITKIAKMQNPSLDGNAIIYTRNLTKIWCGLFSFNALVAFILAFLEDKIYWSIFCGIISYCLVGALFTFEWLYRNFIFKHRFANH